MAIPKPTGPLPQPTGKRRRLNKPASYGLAEPIQAGHAAKQPVLGFDAHELIISMWAALAHSVEGRFYSHADWERARMELWYANGVITGDSKLTPVAWGVIQSGLNELLVSPADKRRAGIELKAAASDPDEDAAVLQMTKYQEKLAQ